jgi:hypothetical protein
MTSEVRDQLNARRDFVRAPAGALIVRPVIGAIDAEPGF